MSGSSDRPTGPRRLQPQGRPVEAEAFGGPQTGVPTNTTGPPDTAPPPRLEPGERSPRSRSRRRNDPSQTTAPIVPAGSVTGRSLTLVITIMCFLACLTAGAVYMMNQSANAWLRDIASEVTVQVEAKERTDVDKVVADVTRFLSSQPGIAAVRGRGMAEP